MRWLVRIALTLGVVACGLAVPAVPGLAATCAGANAASTIRVAIVVDDGNVSPRVDCVVVAAKVRNGELQATGAAVLAARANQLGLPAPRWDSNSGLLCAIDGAPATGCAEQSSGGNYVYWSYWAGESGQWVYSTLGPAYRSVKDGSIEGWRFGNGGGTGQDRAPRTSPSAARCPAVPPPTTAPAPTPTNPPAGGGTPNVPPATKAGGTPGTTARPRATAPSTTVVGSPPSTTTPEATATGPDTSTTIVTTEVTTTTIEAAVEGDTEERTSAASAAVGSDDDGGGGGGGWAGTAIGIGLLGIVGAGVVVVERRRRSG